MNLILILSFIVVILAIVFDIILRMIACWTAAKNDQMGWYIACAIISSFGALPALYLLFFEKEEEKNGNK